MAKKSTAAAAATSGPRKKGPIVCKPGSARAKQIEDTFGFEKAAKHQAERDKRASNGGNSDASSEKGDKS